MSELLLSMLQRLWPHAPQALTEAIAAQSAAVFDKYKINTPLRIAHFMAQISHESNGGTVTAESLTYTHAARIAAVWPTRFTADSAAPFVSNPKALADKVYNGRMGNAVAGDDGYNFRGRGLLQITGRASYRTIGALCGLPLEDHPDMAFAPTAALSVAAAEFVHLGCLPYCDKDDVRIVTRRVNGGYIGLDSRKAWLTRWKLAIPELPGKLPDTDPELQEIAPVDETPVARGGDNDIPQGLTSLAESKTAKAQVGTALSLGAPVAAAVAKGVSDTSNAPAPDPATISNLLDHASTVKDTVERVTELAPDPSIMKLALGFFTDPFVMAVLGAVGVGCIGFTIWERSRKLKEEGA
jgi:putative chitinase